MSGISPQDICAIEHGWRTPYPTWKNRLAVALGVDDPESLFEMVKEVKEVK